MEVDIEEETEVNIQPVEEFEDLLVSPAPTNQEETLDEVPPLPAPTNQEEPLEELPPLPVLSPILPPAVRKSKRSARLNNNKTGAAKTVADPDYNPDEDIETTVRAVRGGRGRGRGRGRAASSCGDMGPGGGDTAAGDGAVRGGRGRRGRAASSSGDQGPGGGDTATGAGAGARRTRARKN